MKTQGPIIDVGLVEELALVDGPVPDLPIVNLGR